MHVYSLRQIKKGSLKATLIDDLNDFGRVSFENVPFETAGGKQKKEIALINEQQATLLLTYFRNNEVVKEFGAKPEDIIRGAGNGVGVAPIVAAAANPATIKAVAMKLVSIRAPPSLERNV